jgi:amidase
VEEVKLAWTPRIDDAANRYYAFAMGSYIAEFARGQEDLLTDYARDYVDQFRNSTPQDFLLAAAISAEMYDDFGPLMERNDLFVCPTATTTRVKADFNSLHDSIEINGKKVASDLSIALCHQFNMLSRCPVLAVPSGTASNGVPTGVQLVGQTYDDEKVFRAGAALEAVHSPFRDAASRPAL